MARVVEYDRAVLGHEMTSAFFTSKLRWDAVGVRGVQCVTVATDNQGGTCATGTGMPGKINNDRSAGHDDRCRGN